MKQCPNCKSVYSDDSLSFCLSDGTALLSMPDEQETRVIPPGRITNQPDFSNVNPNLYHQTPPQSNSKIIFLVVSLFALFLLITIGGIAAYFLVGSKENVSNTQMATPTPKDDDELKKKIADLEKQLQEQKKSPTVTPTAATASVKTPTPLNQSGRATARVGRTGDGFLALRTEPNVETGARILKIPSGATVELEDCQKTFQTIDGRRGRWCMVSYDGKIGWVLDAWLIY
jgi:multidrug efflux pump subunit AcrB